MRRDMFKVLVERPRRGGKWGKDRREANLYLEDLPRKESMKRRHQDRKELNENLKPLQRFFRSRVGRHWDKVYSEVCENINSNSTVQEHVRGHIKDLVRLNVSVKEGKVYDNRYSWSGGYTELWHGDLYVDPDTKILRRYSSKHRRPRWKPPSPEQIRDQALQTLSLVLEEDILYKIHKPKYRSPKNKGPKEVKTKANPTHACEDFSLMQGNCQIFIKDHLTRDLFRFDYFRMLLDLSTKDRERRDREKAALKRKEEEKAGKPF